MSVKCAVLSLFLSTISQEKFFFSANVSVFWLVGNGWFALLTRHDERKKTEYPKGVHLKCSTEAMSTNLADVGAISIATGDRMADVTLALGDKDLKADAWEDDAIMGKTKGRASWS